MRSITWAWIVTSSAVVGSSAISSFGLRRQRHGNHGALAHTAGQLEGILPEPLCRIGYADTLSSISIECRSASAFDMSVCISSCSVI